MSKYPASWSVFLKEKLEVRASIGFVWDIAPTQRDRSMELQIISMDCVPWFCQQNTFANDVLHCYACCCDHDFGSAHPFSQRWFLPVAKTTVFWNVVCPWLIDKHPIYRMLKTHQVPMSDWLKPSFSYVFFNHQNLIKNPNKICLSVSTSKHVKTIKKTSKTIEKSLKNHQKPYGGVLKCGYPQIIYS